MKRFMHILIGAITGWGSLPALYLTICLAVSIFAGFGVFSNTDLDSWVRMFIPFVAVNSEGEGWIKFVVLAISVFGGYAGNGVYNIKGK